jgi:hypothetical protein
MKFFLNAKAWQMFLLIMVPLFLPSPDGVGFFGFLGLSWLASLVVIIVWLYSIGTAANSRLADGLKENPMIYNMGFLLPIVYGVLFSVLFFQADRVQPPIWLLLLHFVAMVGLFYGLRFTAKQFVTFTKGEKVTLADYVGPLFLFWFSPIGVWFLTLDK